MDFIFDVFFGANYFFFFEISTGVRVYDNKPWVDLHFFFCFNPIEICFIIRLHIEIRSLPKLYITIFVYERLYGTPDIRYK